MKPILIVFYFCVAIVLANFMASTAQAQTSDSVQQPLEESVKNKKTKWSLDRKNAKNKHVTYQWYDADKIVEVRIIETDSVEAAAAKLRQEQTKFNGGASTKLLDYGDEAYLYKARRSDASTIILRQGKFFIYVGADRLRDAKEFVKDVCDLTKKQKITNTR